MTIKEALALVIKQLKKIDSPQLDAAILLSAAIKKPKEFLYAYPERKLTPAQIKKYKNFISRRAKHEPVAYILSEKEFYGLKFSVNKSVLIPRPDTETLIDAILKTIGHPTSNIGGRVSNGVSNKNIIDIGTGSGAIAVTLKKLLPNARVFASDVSSAALALAKKNARRLLVPRSLAAPLRSLVRRTGEVGGAKIIFKKGNLFAPFRNVILSAKPEGSRDSSPAAQNDKKIVITANLPYLSRAEWQKTAPEVRKYEPYGALVGGKKGTEIYEKLFKELAGLYSPSGVEGLHYKKSGSNPSTALRSAREIFIFIEIGHNQKPAIAKLAKKILHPWKIEFFKDLAGKWRVAKIIISI